MSFQVGVGFLRGTVFLGGTWNPSANYVIFVMAYWHRRPNSGTQRRWLCISLHYTDIFFFSLFPQFKTKKFLLSSKKILGRSEFDHSNLFQSKKHNSSHKFWTWLKPKLARPVWTKSMKLKNGENVYLVGRESTSGGGRNYSRCRLNEKIFT